MAATKYGAHSSTPRGARRQIVSQCCCCSAATEAELLLAKALEGRRHVLGEQNADTLASMSGTALLYLDQKKYLQADALLSTVLEGRRRILGPDHPDTGRALDALGRMRLEQQRYAEAEKLLREALMGQEKNRNSWERYNSESMLGASLAGQRRFGEAEPLLLSGYQGLVQREATIPWEDRSALQQAGERILQLYKAWEKPEQAADWRNRLPKP